MRITERQIQHLMKPRPTLTEQALALSRERRRRVLKAWEVPALIVAAQLACVAFIAALPVALIAFGVLAPVAAVVLFVRFAWRAQRRRRLRP